MASKLALLICPTLEDGRQNSSSTSGIASTRQSATRINQVTSRRGIDTGICVPTRLGNIAEKKMTWLTDTTATTNLTASADSVTSAAGRNISETPSAAALATSSGSGICSAQVIG